jgi:hypothetical protein
MCPVCLATLGLYVAGAAASADGLTALAVKVSRKKNATEIVPNSNQRRNQDVNEHDREPENSFV